MRILPRRDGPPRLPAGLPATLPPPLVAAWWLTCRPSPSARSGRARRGPAPRAPPAAPFLVWTSPAPAGVPRPVTRVPRSTCRAPHRW